MLGLICESVKAWLDDDAENRIAIHCKAGKGRTGTVICALLLHLGICKTADESMAFYGRMRTDDGKGVTIKSQQRYVRYYGQMLRKLEEQGKSDLVDEELKTGEGGEVPTTTSVGEGGGISAGAALTAGMIEVKDSIGGARLNVNVEKETEAESKDVASETFACVLNDADDVANPIGTAAVNTEKEAFAVVDPGAPKVYRLTKVRFLNAPKVLTTYFKVEVPVRMTDIEEFGLEDRIIENKVVENGETRKTNPSALGKSFANRTSQSYESWSTPPATQSGDGGEEGGRNGSGIASGSGSRWNTDQISDSTSSSEDDDDEEEDDLVAGKHPKSGRLPVKARKSRSVGTLRVATPPATATTTTANIVDTQMGMKNTQTSYFPEGASNMGKSSAETDGAGATGAAGPQSSGDTDVWMDEADYSVLGGEEFRFAMVLVHDSRDFQPSDNVGPMVTRSITRSDSASERQSTPDAFVSSLRADSGASDGSGNPLYDFPLYDASGAKVNADTTDTTSSTRTIASSTSTSLELAGDTLFRFKDKGQNLFHFWFHTNFIPEDDKLVLTKNQLDCKGIKKNKAYADEFAVELTFVKLSQDGDKSHSCENEASDSIDGVRTRQRAISQFAFRRSGDSGSHSASSSLSRYDTLKSFRSADNCLSRKNSGIVVKEEILEHEGGSDKGTDMAATPTK